MDTLFGRRNFKLDSMFDFGHLDSRVQRHLKKVYTTLGVGMLFAALGAYISIYLGVMRNGLLLGLLPFGLLTWLLFTPDEPKNLNKRLGIFYSLTTVTGYSLGPLLNMAIAIDQGLVTTAVLSTSLIFFCFSMSALLSRNRSFLYLGGILMSGLGVLFLLGLANLFFKSELLFNINLYAGLAIFCGFVLFDTQLTIEKARMGSNDYVMHALDLFIDFIHIFKSILIILMKKDGDKKKRKR